MPGGVPMSGIIVDKRHVKNKSAPNRKAFIDRYKHVLKKHVDRLAGADSRSITDIAKKREITINKKDLEEPEYSFGDQGIWDRVIPGNKQFNTGDRIPINPKGASQGAGQGGGESEVDDFVFTLTEDEFINILFSGLELPDFVKNGMKITEFSHMQRAGYRKEGSPCQLDLKKTFENAIARRIATKNTNEDKEVPYLDDIDLRYKNFLEVSKPSRQALMFCVLDVSGSMDETLKGWAKKYFLLLYMFLKKTYTDVEVVFIRHHDTAQEVPEKEFFYAKDTGGTTISSALRLVSDIIKERYSTNDINIYISQCSDGENWPDDTELSLDILRQELLPEIQYYAYLEVAQRRRFSMDNTWYNILDSQICPHHKKVKVGKASDEAHLFPVFRDLFKKS